MTALEKMRDFVGSYPGADILSEFRIDYTDQIPSNGGLFPSGLVEISRRSDILGNATVTNQYNFGLYCNLERAPGDDVQATINADWLMGFQEWVQAQSIQGLAPYSGMTQSGSTLSHRTVSCTALRMMASQPIWCNSPSNS